ncbi:MAG: hypothetical protein JSW52_00810 [Candidatus Coatesbacteria bacterium]|nr:MAG: hypothetical protein JSW52_00810 [Candidatus Coatesbacteria bacterium]
MSNNYGMLKAATYLTLFLAAAPAAALTLAATTDPYCFDVAGSGDSFRILGRSLAVGGHNVYVEHAYTRAEDDGFFANADNDARERELKEFYEGKHLRLVDGAGREYEAVNARFVKFQYFGWDSDVGAQIIEFTYPAEASGNLELIVKTDEESAARLDIGPADKNYYRRGIVTADEGLNFRISPSVTYAATEVMEAGDTFFLLGGRSCSYVDKEREKKAYFYEVIRDGREGWVARGIEGEEDEYFTVGNFTAF